jgi:hypothetical protein
VAPAGDGSLSWGCTTDHLLAGCRLGTECMPIQREGTGAGPPCVAPRTAKMPPDRTSVPARVIRRQNRTQPSTYPDQLSVAFSAMPRQARPSIEWRTSPKRGQNEPALQWRRWKRRRSNDISLSRTRTSIRTALEGGNCTFGEAGPCSFDTSIAEKHH